MKNDLHEGQRLAEYMKLNHITKADLSKKLAISRSMLCYHLRRPFLSHRFKVKLLAVGIELFPLKSLPKITASSDNAELLYHIKMLEKVIDSQKEFISHITRKCRHGVCLNFVLK